MEWWEYGGERERVNKVRGEQRGANFHREETDKAVREGRRPGFVGILGKDEEVGKGAV